MGARKHVQSEFSCERGVVFFLFVCPWNTLCPCVDGGYIDETMLFRAGLETGNQVLYTLLVRPCKRGESK